MGEDLGILAVHQPVIGVGSFVLVSGDDVGPLGDLGGSRHGSTLPDLDGRYGVWERSSRMARRVDYGEDASDQRPSRRDSNRVVSVRRGTGMESLIWGHF